MTEWYMAPCKSRQLDDPRVKSDHRSTHTNVSSILPSQIQKIHSGTTKHLAVSYSDQTYQHFKKNFHVTRQKHTSTYSSSTNAEFAANSNSEPLKMQPTVFSTVPSFACIWLQQVVKIVRQQGSIDCDDCPFFLSWQVYGNANR